jgi:hypothetical protein
MDERVIDLLGYLEGKGSGRTHFGVWGGEGVRARFALPAWRAVNLVGASRAGLLYLEDPERSPTTLFVLDLGSDEPRTDFSATKLPPPSETPRVLHEVPGEIVIYLCTVGNVPWYLALDGGSWGQRRLGAEQREQLLFFAGECAGLLLHHGVGDDGPVPSHARELNLEDDSDPGDSQSGES